MGLLRTGLAALLAALAVSAPSAAQPAAAPTRKADLHKLARGLVAAGAPGAVVFVRTPSGVRSATSGFASLQPRIRMQAGDRYRIASVTKPFVATVVLQLVSEGRLSLEDSVERRLPGLVPNGAAITVRELLNHTSGLFNYTDDEVWLNAILLDPGRHWSPRELVRVAVSHPPYFAPGTNWAYSNTNYVLLGLIIEAVTGRKLDQELSERLFGPLALRSTSFPTAIAIEGAIRARLHQPPGQPSDRHHSSAEPDVGVRRGRDGVERSRRDDILLRAAQGPALARSAARGDEERLHGFRHLRTRTAYHLDSLRASVRSRRRLPGVAQRRLGHSERPPRRRCDGERGRVACAVEQAPGSDADRSLLRLTLRCVRLGARKDRGTAIQATPQKGGVRPKPFGA
jgi:CubicO group peptidase (beta-lactamase class C family)